MCWTRRFATEYLGMRAEHPFLLSTLRGRFWYNTSSGRGKQIVQFPRCLLSGWLNRSIIYSHTQSSARFLHTWVLLFVLHIAAISNLIATSNATHLISSSNSAMLQEAQHNVVYTITSSLSLLKRIFDRFYWASQVKKREWRVTSDNGRCNKFLSYSKEEQQIKI